MTPSLGRHVDRARSPRLFEDSECATGAHADRRVARVGLRTDTRAERCGLRVREPLEHQAVGAELGCLHFQLRNDLIHYLLPAGLEDTVARGVKIGDRLEACGWTPIDFHLIRRNGRSGRPEDDRTRGGTSLEHAAKNNEYRQWAHWGDHSVEEDGCAASTRCSAENSTGFTRWASKPLVLARCRSSA